MYFRKKPSSSRNTNNMHYDSRGRLLGLKESIQQRQARLDFIHRRKLNFHIPSQKEVHDEYSPSSSSLSTQVKAAIIIQRAYRVYRAEVALRLFAKTVLNPNSASHRSLGARHSFLRARSSELGVLGSWLDATTYIAMNPRVQSAAYLAALALKRSWIQLEEARRNEEEMRTFGHESRRSTFVHKQKVTNLGTPNAPKVWWPIGVYDPEDEVGTGDDFVSTVEVLSAEDSSDYSSSTSSSSESSSDCAEEDEDLGYTEHHDFAPPQIEEEHFVPTSALNSLQIGISMRDRWLRQQRYRLATCKKMPPVSRAPSLASINEKGESDIGFSP